MRHAVAVNVAVDGQGYIKRITWDTVDTDSRKRDRKTQSASPKVTVNTTRGDTHVNHDVFCCRG